MKNCRILMVVVVLTIFITIIAANAEIYRGTGYFPPGKNGYQSGAEAAIEGGAYDKFDNLLRPLQNYKEGSYVSIAVDKRRIPLGSEVEIKEFPGVKFIACDIGRRVRGAHLDLCVANKTESYKIPRKLTVNIVRRGDGHFQASGGTIRGNGSDGQRRIFKDGAIYLCRSLFERWFNNAYEMFKDIQNNDSREEICSRSLQQRHGGLGGFAAM